MVDITAEVLAVRLFGVTHCTRSDTPRPHLLQRLQRKLLKLRPDFTIREADAFYRMYCFSPEYIEKMNGALRQAGLPE